MTFTTHALQINGINLNCWFAGEASLPALLMLHGWADSGATFSFVAEHLKSQFHIVAPDLRGFGDSAWAAHGYWFPEYLADVEVLTVALWGNAPFDLIGHSMGANIAGLYAGAKPARVKRLVLLDGFGLPPTRPEQAVKRYRNWLEDEDSHALRDFESRDALLTHLRRLAPRARDGVLAYVADCWATSLGDGRWRLKMDPRHKRAYPILYRREEAQACWRETTAPVLAVSARESNFLARFHGMDVIADLAQCYCDFTHHQIADAGHMLHWEQPQAVAELLKQFLT